MPLTRRELAAWLDGRGAKGVDLRPDKSLSISSQLVRAEWKGRSVVGVGSDTKASPAAAALVDLVHMQQNRLDRPLTLLVADGRPGTVDAACTLRAALKVKIDIELCELPDLEAEAQPPLDGWDPPDFSTSKKATRWAKLLESWRTVDPPTLAQELCEKIQHPSVRLYPQLSQNPRRGRWSLRIDGLEVARVGPRTGEINVGRTGATGNNSKARKAWLSVHPGGMLPFTEANVEDAAARLATLIDQFETDEYGMLKHGQPEHALESAVLRGEVKVHGPDGNLLHRWLEDDSVSRGSQFPTLWTETGRPRYLDALLKDDRTPWAVELKVPLSGGSGSYYRHGLAQAVLYRHFIRTATPVHVWFRQADTDPESCRAAVAFPQGPAATAANIKDLCELGVLFDVHISQLSPSSDS